MILIAGAGIGGLTLGCALRRTDRPFRIVERAAELRPTGAGIAIAPNALRALAHVGLELPVRSAGHELRFAAICSPNGKVLIGAHVRDIAGGSIALTRADLQTTLLTDVERNVELRTAVVGYDQPPTNALVHLSNGEIVTADLLVGADGIHSTVRRLMRGDEPLRYSGQTSWRAVVDHVAGIDDGRFTETWGAGLRFGIVPLGKGRVYWFAVADAPCGEHDHDDPRPGLQTRFANWHAPIARLLDSTPREHILRTDIFDRPPINVWVDGRTVLLGDAAHPMTPDGGMGGCQAIEDAIVLADALANEDSIPAALASYQARRVRRANRFVKQSYRVGQLAHMRSAPLRWLRNRALRVVPISLVTRAMARDFDFTL